MNRATSLLGGISFVLLGAPVAAQMAGGQRETLWRLDGGSADLFLGASVSDLGDLDGDGIPEILVGATNPDGYAHPGSAYVYSGSSGALLWQGSGTGLDSFGNAVAGLGDVDGDGIDDFAVGAFLADTAFYQAGGSVFVYSAGTGILLWRLDGSADGSYFGYSIAGPGDVDGDGCSDILIGAPQDSPGSLFQVGSAYLFSGGTGSLLHRFDGPSAGDFLGSSVSEAGDLDLDGVPDLAIGAMGASPGGKFQAGSVFIFSGGSGNQLFRFDGTSSGDSLGHSVASGRDLDGDQVPDVVAGAPYVWSGILQYAGSVTAYSGATGSLIWQVTLPYPWLLLGFSLSCASDVDGDKTPDVIAGTPGVATYVLSGPTGSTVWRIDGGGGSFGRAVSAGGDLDVDGLSEVLVGSAEAGNNGLARSGSVYAYSQNPFISSSSDVLSLSSGVPIAITLTFPQSEANFPYRLLASSHGYGPSSLAGIEVPLTVDSLLLKMAGGWNPPLLGNAIGTLNASGGALATVSPHAALAPFVGKTVFMAAVTHSPFGYLGRLSSIAVDFTIEP